MESLLKVLEKLNVATIIAIVLACVWMDNSFKSEISRLEKRFDSIEKRLDNIEQNHLEHLTNLHVKKAE